MLYNIYKQLTVSIRSPESRGRFYSTHLDMVLAIDSEATRAMLKMSLMKHLLTGFDVLRDGNFAVDVWPGISMAFLLHEYLSHWRHFTEVYGEQFMSVTK